MFEHCNQKFKPYEVWYLYDNKGFYDRSLALGRFNYSSQDVKTKQCKMTLPKHLRYGENKIVNIGGKKYQRMNAVSKYGLKECIKDIPVDCDSSFF